MYTTWILAADENRCRIFETLSRTSELEERETLVHPESKLPERELISSASGRKQSGSSGAHNVNERGKVHQHHSQLFAKDIAKLLKQGLEEKRFNKLVLVAAPKFLGVLRKEIDTRIARHICLELDKDLSKLDADELRKHLPTPLPTITES